jgi:hypothetical protein
MLYSCNSQFPLLVFPKRKLIVDENHFVNVVNDGFYAFAAVGELGACV